MLSTDLRNLTGQFELARCETGAITLSGDALNAMIASLQHMHQLAEHFENIEVPQTWRQTKQPFADNVIVLPVAPRFNTASREDQTGGAA